MSAGVGPWAVIRMPLSGTIISMERFYAESTDEEIRREKDKARRLRETPWWRQKKARGICHYCGRKFPPAELTMDHLVPLVRGGKSVKANLVPACKDCNSKKKHMLPTEWAEYLERLKEGGGGIG